MTNDQREILRGTYEDIDIPVLQMHGTLDESIPIDAARDLTSRLVDARFVAIDNLSRVFPELTPKPRDRLARASFEHCTLVLLEGLSASRHTREEQLESPDLSALDPAVADEIEAGGGAIFVGDTRETSNSFPLWWPPLRVASPGSTALSGTSSSTGGCARYAMRSMESRSRTRRGSTAPDESAWPQGVRGPAGRPRCVRQGPVRAFSRDFRLDHPSSGHAQLPLQRSHLHRRYKTKPRIAASSS